MKKTASFTFPSLMKALSNQPNLTFTYRANFICTMSLRRSSRNTKPNEHVVDNVIKKEPKRLITTTTTTTTNVKRIKKQVKLEQQDLTLPNVIKVSPPNDWEVVFDTLESYRKVHKAVVDTMGCERLADDNASPVVQRFQTLVALMLSSQTKDTVTSATIKKMKNELKGGLCIQSILQVDEGVLDMMIRSVGFHTKKASYIKRTAEILRDQYNGDIPDTIEGLTNLPGVGPKMGYLTLQCAWDKNLGIGVDVHVHRISNRLRWVKTNTPEETRLSLQSWLPKDKWRSINPLLVGYGQIVCLPRGPKCDICPVSQYCPSVEIKKKVTTKKTIKKLDNDKVESIHFKKEELDW